MFSPCLSSNAVTRRLALQLLMDTNQWRIALRLLYLHLCISWEHMHFCNSKKQTEKFNFVMFSWATKSILSTELPNLQFLELAVSEQILVYWFSVVCLHFSSKHFTVWSCLTAYSEPLHILCISKYSSQTHANALILINAQNGTSLLRSEYLNSREVQHTFLQTTQWKTRKKKKRKA